MFSADYCGILSLRACEFIFRTGEETKYQRNAKAFAISAFFMPVFGVTEWK